ncbi:MAG: peptidylprolyl isomerase [Lentisphaeria bacterium]
MKSKALRRIFGGFLATAFLGEGSAAAAAAANPRVEFETSLGRFTVELFATEAPITVKNVLEYVDGGHYAGTIFHRVIPGFMIQGGGLLPDLSPKSTRAPIKNEAANGLKNRRGTLSMARTSVVDSATSQFFVNVADNAFLDHQDGSPRGYGYAVFGKVVEGMAVVDKIVAVRTATQGMHQNVPVEPVVIRNATRQGAAAAAP